MKLSPTMEDLVRYMREHGGKIVRHPGGFWAHEGWIFRAELSYGTTSVEALVKRGVATYTKWQDRKSGNGRFPIEATLA